MDYLRDICKYLDLNVFIVGNTCWYNLSDLNNKWLFHNGSLSHVNENGEYMDSVDKIHLLILSKLRDGERFKEDSLNIIRELLYSRDENNYIIAYEMIKGLKENAYF